MAVSEVSEISAVSKKPFQDRLTGLSRGFNKLVHEVNLPKNGKEEVIITYSGDEIFDGVYSDNADVIIRQVEDLDGEVRVRAIVKSANVGSINRAIVFYFDPETPFYTMDGHTVLPNSQKLKRSVNFKITGYQDFDTYDYNFGEVLEGEPVDFKFFYTGQDKIAGVKGTCGCTNVTLDGNTIYGKLSTEGLKENVVKTINIYFGDCKRQFEVVHGVLIPNKNSYTTILTIRGHVLPKNKE